MLEWLAVSSVAQDFAKTINQCVTQVGVRPAEPEDEMDVLQELLDQGLNDALMVAGTTVFLVAQTWWSAWCTHTGGGKGEGPGQINNNTILDQTATAQVLRLRAGLEEGTHFKVLRE